jgi:hypothetical protein
LGLRISTRLTKRSYWESRCKLRLRALVAKTVAYPTLVAWCHLTKLEASDEASSWNIFYSNSAWLLG